MTTASTFVDVVIIRQFTGNHAHPTFTYRVPPEWAHAGRRGRIVSVEFSHHTTTAVVIHAHDTPPARPCKDILAVADIWLTPQQITLAEWVSHHHATSLARALEFFVPASLLPDEVVYWSATARGLAVDYATLPVDERGVMYLLRQHGRQTIADIQARTNQHLAKVRRLIRLLHDRGLAESVVPITPPTRSTETWAEVARTPQAADEQWFQRATRQQRLFQRILAAPGQRLQVQALGGARQLAHLVTRGLVTLKEAALPPVIPAPITPGVALSDAQERIVADILPDIHTRTHSITLLHGITGSGKTEIYFALIEACIAQHKQVLVLVPEIALTTQLAQRFQHRFPGRVSIIHGQITSKQRRERWQACLHAQSSIVLGPRSAIATPLPQLGLIVVDEEHDASFKNDHAPYVHVRNAAMVYAKISGVPIVLGSATPSVEMMYAAQQQRVNYVKLPERVNQAGERIARPPIRIVDLRQERCIDQYGLISTVLATHITETIANDQHVLLLLNRRGNSGARICRNCGHRDNCQRCSTPLISHLRNGQSLGICHTCGWQKLLDSHCPDCFHADFLVVGSGTQRISQLMALQFPSAEIIQWDRDTATTARDHAALLAQAQSARRAIIVGTQMIAKGLDIANIALVGVINTDTALALPDFRAAEQTYQLLTQVAGRAGRRGATAHVILQSYQPEHYAIQAAAHYHDDAFYQAELAFRAQLGYPPYARMIKLVWSASHEAEAAQRAQHESGIIQQLITTEMPAARLIGPAPAFFSKIRNQYRWQLLIVAPRSEAVIALITGQHHAIVDVDPVVLL
jgi:primosomal protein N' (replication factor Y)